MCLDRPSKFPYAADRSYTPPDAPVENLRRLHQHLGISRAVIVHASCHGTDMAVTLDAIASSDGSYRGVACVEDAVTDRELQNACTRAGSAAFDSISSKHLGGVPDLAVFYRRCSRESSRWAWHVVLHLDAEDILTQQELLERHRCALHHRSHGTRQSGRRTGAAPVSVCCSRFTANNSLAWIKVCGSERVSAGKRPFRDAVPFAQALIAVDPHRILVGHRLAPPEYHKGHAERRRAGRSVRRDLPGSRVLQRRILVDNPSRMYWAD